MKVNEVIVEDAGVSKNGTPKGNPAQGSIWLPPTPPLNNNPPPVQSSNVASNTLKKSSNAAVNKLKNFSKSAAGNISTGVSNWLRTRAGGENLKMEIDAWKKFAGQRKSIKDMDDPDVFKTELEAWAKKRFPSAGNDVDINKENITPGLFSRSVENYITKMYNASMTNRQLGKTAPAGNQETDQPQTTTAPDGTQTTPAGIVIPPKRGGRLRQPQNQPPTNDQSVEQQALAQGISVISHEPIIFSAGKGRQYGLDDNGRWIHLASGKVQPEALQAFLTQQHNTLLGLK